MRSNRVRLNRSDATLMLQAKFIVCFVLVAARADGSDVFFRFVDSDFALELLEFISSEKDSISFTPSSCHDSSTFRTELAKALAGNLPERVRLAVTRQRIERHLPGASLEIHRDESGELTLVSVEDFYSYFIPVGVPAKNEAHAAIFGSPRLRESRLRDVGLRPEVVAEIEGLSNPILLGGTWEEEVCLIAENSDGQESCVFARVETPTHWGYVHAAGFSISISYRLFRDERWIHEVDALIDPAETIHLPDHPDLWHFLEHCTDDAVLFPQERPGRRLEAKWINGLRRASFFARSLRQAGALPGWIDVTHLGNATDDEAMCTMAWLAEISTNPGVVGGFGFVVSQMVTDYESFPVTCEIPVVANIADKTVIAWLKVDATLYVTDGRTCGIKIDHVVGSSLELRSPLEKATPYPELVVHGSWPLVALTGDGAEQSESDATEWGLELRSVQPR